MVISMTLFTFLLTTLSFWYMHISRSKIELQQMKSSALCERYFCERLSSIFAKTTLDSKTGITTFYNNGNSIIFTFDNGLSHTPLLSNTVLASLFHDPQEKTLCLTIWPQPKSTLSPTGPSKTCVLREDVSTVDFSFFSPFDPYRQTVDPQKVGREPPSKGWQNNWNASYHSLPALVKMTFNKDNEEEKTERLFSLPYPIVLPKELV
ncbi:MAG: hypothetical protein S4CHLAM45_11300 [Chlamydiales bacterium]|nr:hypothetical protein [Chlamydiales bacterium]MCH9619622.1 hypothetical protein [Chlamydiales bacterium]MCH9623228.1 hypothetical protein [Chlamydiales bacterium]